jgi:hypothetical protein
MQQLTKAITTEISRLPEKGLLSQRENSADAKGRTEKERDTIPKPVGLGM